MQASESVVAFRAHLSSATSRRSGTTPTSGESTEDVAPGASPKLANFAAPRPCAPPLYPHAKPTGPKVGAVWMGCRVPGRQDGHRRGEYRKEGNVDTSVLPTVTLGTLRKLGVCLISLVALLAMALLM